MVSGTDAGGTEHSLSPKGRETLMIIDPSKLAVGNGHLARNTQLTNHMPLSTRHVMDMKAGGGGYDLSPSDMAKNNKQFKETFMTMEPKLVRNLDSIDNCSSVPSPDLISKLNQEFRE